MNVSGCVKIEGNVEIILNGESNNETFQLISYNCTSKLSFNDSQLIVKTNYKKNKCDEINPVVNNNINSLSISVSTSFDKRCNKSLGTGVILAIIFGIIGIILIVFVVIFIYKWRKKKYFNSVIKKIEMISMESNINN